MWNSPMPFQVAPISGSEKSDDNTDEETEASAADSTLAYASEARLHMALDAARMGVWDWDLQTGELSWSAWHYALFGLDIKQAVGAYRDFEEHIHPDDKVGLEQAIQRARDTRAEFRHEYRVILPDGTARWVAGHGRFFYDADGKAIRMTGVLMDVTERHWLLEQMEAQMTQVQTAFHALETRRHQLEETNARLAQANIRLEELVTTDELTGLKNKRAFTEFLELEYRKAVRSQRPLSVILLDADNFKQVNDLCGHPTGDVVLRRIGELLLSHTRQTDMAARFGGEEFVYVLPDTDQVGAIAVAERVRLALETYPWQEHPVTASFGVATGILTTANAADLIAQADRALYHSKRAGRNRVTHFVGISATL